jgi:hypothetical protein
MEELAETSTANSKKEKPASGGPVLAQREMEKKRSPLV